MIIKYLGHSAFEFQTNEGNVLIDPFISQNPEYYPENITEIFVTHGHADHLGSAIEISKKQATPITAIFELANYCNQQGAIANSVSMGGKIKFPWGWAVFTPAFHSSSTPDGQYAGAPAGIMFEINGVKIFHAGDTALNSEIKIIKELYSPQIALLPIGGCYTMDIEQAVIASEWLGADIVIPMHYNTFPAINTDADAFKKELATNGINCVILKKNETLKY
jgi:L-ascorbate metabolism protein UlaG (beta-lactamase superfamily)